ncbi:MAG: hypothetical protein ABIO81_13575 [Ginsengibacter sp.]
MKKLYFLAVTISGFLFMLQSCSKQSASDLIAPVSPKVINATIGPNQIYQFSISSAGNVIIEKQALHYTISKTEQGAKTGEMIYQYLPAKDYTGKDEVVLSSQTMVSRSDGRCNSYQNNGGREINYYTSFTTIKLLIGN